MMSLIRSNRWLIVRNGAVGDTVLLSPLIQAIRRQESCAWIEVMGHLERVSLLEGSGMADRVVSSEIEGLEALYAPQGELPERLRDYLAEFDRILFFSGQAYLGMKERLAVRRDQWVRVWEALPPKKEPPVHCVEHYLSAMADIVDISNPPLPRIIITEPEKIQADELLELWGIDRDAVRLIALHVGAGGVAKQAPAKVFLNELEKIKTDQPLHLLLIQGYADCKAVDSFRQILPKYISCTIVQNKSLRKVAALLQRCDGYIGNDSGISHIAAAVGCKSTVYFQASDPRMWAPKGEGVRVLRLGDG